MNATSKVEFSSKESANNYAISKLSDYTVSYNSALDWTTYKQVNKNNNTFITVKKSFKEDLNGNIIFIENSPINCYSVEIINQKRY